MDELAIQSLDLVNRELTGTLETARGEIEDYVDGESDSEALVRAASMLHLAAGALKIVEIHGAALLAEEMEQTCRAIHEGGTRTEQGVEALTRAMVQLPAYLERLMSGGSDVALVLLPLLNDLRTSRSKPMLSEGTLLLLNTGPFERFRQQPAKDTGASFGNQVAALAQKLRPRFQSALLAWIRGGDSKKPLEELIEVCDSLEETAESEPVRQLWAVTAGVLTALANGDIEGTMQVKRLIGQADRQLKRLIDSGEQVFVSAPPVDLLNSLLYYVARAPSEDPRIVELRRVFGVDTVIPGAEEIERAREDLAGPSARLMRTVADAIREDLGGVKDVLDIFVRTGMENVADLKPQLEMLKKIGDTLGVLGFEAAREKIQTESEQLAGIVESDAINDAADLEAIATSLLDVEDMLERELVVAAPQGQSEGTGDDALESNQVRHVTTAVMRECIVNLAKIKDAVVKVLDDQAAVSALDQVNAQMRGIVAGLLMLNKNRAVNVIERIGRNVTTRLTSGSDSLNPKLIERLADSIVSIEYYMETIALGRSDPDYMLDNANRCLDVLEGVAREESKDAAQDEAAAQPPSAAEPELEPDATVAEEDAGKLSVMEVDEERSEPELVEVFIEEAKEELEKIRENLPRWMDQPQDAEALIAVRRSFHTLKGSGRVIGAQLLGEFAWGVENLLNRIINQTLPPNPAMLDFIGQATGVLPELIEQLEIGIRPAADIDAIIARAHAFADGEPDGRAPSEAPAVAAAGTDEAAAETMDPVLRQIFVKEVREHLTAIREFVGHSAATSPPVTVTEPLHRACHTLFGSARMADCAPAIELAEPLARRVSSAFESGRGLEGQAVATIGRFANEIERLIAALEASEPLTVDAGLVGALKQLEIEPAPTEATAVEEEAAVEDEPGLPADAGAADAEPAGTEPFPDDESADYDPEIAAIFCDEASELLEQADTQLQMLRQSPGSEPALAELKRLLHTLKGGARLAGIVTMGDLSHVLETFVPKIAAQPAGADNAGIELAQQTLDRLHQMRDAVDSGQAAAPASELLERLEGFGEAAVEAPPEPEPEPEPEPIELKTEPEPEPEIATPAGDEPPEPQAPEPEAEWPAVPASVPAPEPVPDTRPEAAPAPLEQTVAVGARAERAEMARVDAGLLDELLNEAGEISIFQSRLNQQLHAVEFHLGELGQTVTRLREQLRSLEAETEAQILHRHQGEADGDERFDPLELDRYSTIQQLSRALAETSNDVASINELLHGLTSEADTLLTQQTRVTTELSDGLMQTRMVSFDRHATRLSRIVRQAAQDTGKSAELSIEGARSQIDRQILEALVPALEHVLRNAVVHGIESADSRAAAGKPAAGNIRLSVRREGAEVIIEIADDGAGLNLDAIRRKAIEKGVIQDGVALADSDIVDLILLPGFSTADELTQAAGRGVGMDVVDNEIKRLGGSMRIGTEAGKGTRFLLRLPYTLAITHALVVNVGDETFALPLPTVEGIARVRREQLLELLTEDDPRLAHGDGSYRVQHLGSLVGSAPSALPEDEGAVSLVLVRAGENSTALLTDSLEGSREIIVKTLGPHIASVAGVSGATILGDGRVVVILDAGTLVRAQHQDEVRAQAPPAVVAEKRALSALVVDDSITMRRVTQRLLERRGVRVHTARDGLDAIEVLREHEADIILLDIEMPRMDGYQFATHVRNDDKLREMPIIMVTSRSGEKHRARAIEIGVNDYLSKPYNEAELVAAIEALVGRSI